MMWLLYIMVANLYMTSMVSCRTTTTEEPDDEATLDESPHECITTKTEVPGICVPYTYCNEVNDTIMTGGYIVQTDLRESSPYDCGLNNWCCSLPNYEKPTFKNSGKIGSCLAPKSDIIPWAVSLYKVTKVKQAKESLYCVGSLVGSRVILTAATCVIAGQGYTLYAKMPNSDNPDIKYKIRHRHIHPKYNSGSHAFDFGLLVLEEEVTWEDDEVHGACIASSEPKGMGMTLGTDANDELTSTILELEPGACKNFGSSESKDQVCGTNSDDVCIVANGAPVLYESKPGVIVGVARSGCVNDQVLLGSLSKSLPWIHKHLSDMKVPKGWFTKS